MESYDELLSWAYDLQKFGIKFGLSSTEWLLERLGNPHHGRKFIHIGGTNGKGSVAAVLSAVLTASGLRTGLYTSPHLIRFEERFRVNDRMIDRETTRELMARAREAVNEKEPPTFFEFTTAMALDLFARENTDFAIMEVGMGGRLDSTNIIRPLASIITTISLEHQQYLGDTLASIAGEKAGIIKSGVPLVSAVTQDEVVRIFADRCRELGSPFYLLGRDFSARETDGAFGYQGLHRSLTGLVPGLPGRHQADNAALALCALELLEPHGFSWDETIIRHGVESPRWPGRFQVVADNPVTVLDGAHNPGAARTLADTVKRCYPGKRVVMVVGMMADKDIRAALGIFFSAADEAILTRPAYTRAASPEVLAEEAGASSIPVETCPNLKEAIERGRAKAGRDGVLVITGSLFTVGETMEILGLEA